MVISCLVVEHGCILTSKFAASGLLVLAMVAFTLAAGSRTLAAPLTASSNSQTTMKTAKECNDEYRRDRAIFEARKETIAEFIRLCWTTAAGQPTPAPGDQKREAGAARYVEHVASVPETASSAGSVRARRMAAPHERRVGAAHLRHRRAERWARAEIGRHRAAAVDRPAVRSPRVVSSQRESVPSCKPAIITAYADEAGLFGLRSFEAVICPRIRPVRFTGRPHDAARAIQDLVMPLPRILTY